MEFNESNIYKTIYFTFFLFLYCINIKLSIKRYDIIFISIIHKHIIIIKLNITDDKII